MLITPGATAYLLSDRFGHILLISIALGAGSCFLGAYVSYFLDGATGGVIICLQTLIFLGAFVYAPRHGLRAARRQAQRA
jgi:manganese/iron transport system permease protein